MIEKKLLIFDLDGTLADTRQDIAEAVNHALTRLGHAPLSLEKVTSYVGDGITTLMQRALPRHAEHELEQALQAFHAFYSQHFADRSTLYPGVLDVLQHFNARKKAVFSNKQEKYTLGLIERLGIRPHFDLVLGSRPEIARKPEPDGIHFICRELNIPESETLMIGDNSTDILAGKAAGVTTCAALYGFRPAETLLPLEPDFTINSMVELKKHIRT